MPPPAWPQQNGRHQSVDVTSRLVVEQRQSHELGIRTHMDQVSSTGAPAAMSHLNNGSNHLQQTTSGGGFGTMPALLPPVNGFGFAAANGYGPGAGLPAIDIPTSMAPTTHQSSANGGHQSFANGGLQSFANGGLQSFANGGPQAFANGGLQSFANGSPHSLANGGHHHHNAGQGPQAPLYPAQMQTNGSTYFDPVANRSNGYYPQSQMSYNEPLQYPTTTQADEVYTQMATGQHWLLQSGQQGDNHHAGYNGEQLSSLESINSMQSSQGAQYFNRAMHY